MADDLAFALELADLADSLTLPRFRAGDLVVESKPDMTPVTEVDRGVEMAIRERVAAARPGETVFGEEFGPPASSGEGRWIVDPIDGTKNFVRGIPAFATLIALERDGVLVASVASAPALGRRWWARRGGGAFADGSPIHVSNVNRLEDAQLCYSNFSAWEEAGLLEPFLALGQRAWRTRGFGDFWQYVLVAEGSAEIALEPNLALWDIAAVKLIVQEAGGLYTNLAGDAALVPGSAVASNGLLHDEVLAALRMPRSMATVLDDVGAWFETQQFVLTIEPEGKEFAAMLRHVTKTDDPSNAVLYAKGPSPVLAALVAEQRWKAEQVGSGTVSGTTYLDKAHERLRRLGLEKTT